MTVEHEIEALAKDSVDMLQNAKGYVIESQETYEKIGEFLRGIKGLQKKINETFDPMVKDAHRTWKGIIAKRDEHLEPLVKAEKIVKKKSLFYIEEKEKIKKEEERKAREEAEAEEKKQKEKLEKQADKAEAKGDTEKAEEKREQADQVTVPVKPVDTGFEKVNGQIVKEVWKAEVTDLKALIYAVGGGQAPISFINANLPAINKQAKATKDTLQFPGVRFYSEKEMAVR